MTEDVFNVSKGIVGLLMLYLIIWNTLCLTERSWSQSVHFGGSCDERVVVGYSRVAYGLVLGAT